MAGFEYDYVTLLALRMLCKEFISISLAFSFGQAKTITIRLRVDAILLFQNGKTRIRVNSLTAMAFKEFC